VEFRKTVVDVLQAVPGCVVVGEAANGLEAVEQARSLRPSLVVMDMHMPVMGGLAAMRALKGELPRTHIVMMSTVLEAEVRDVALSSGAVACIEKGRDLWKRLPRILLELLQSGQAS